MHDSASALCTGVPLVLLESGALGSKRATNPRRTPRGSRVKSHTDRMPIHSTYLKNRPLRCRRFTDCHVDLLLVDVAPIGRPILITRSNDARFLRDHFQFFSSFSNYGAGHGSPSRSFFIESPLEESKFFMPLTSFGRSARRLVSRINWTWLQFSQL